ncbi:MAG: carbohydrate kinase family protein [Thermotogota bacterium]
MKISIIGGINYDLSINAYNKIIPFDSNPSKISYSAGGVSRNIAEVLGKLFKTYKNHNIYLYGVVGDDPEGDFILKQTERSGVDCSNVLKNNKINTGKYVTFNENNGDMYVAANDMRIFDYLDNDILKKWKHNLIDSDVVLLDANLNIDLINEILYLLPKNIITIIETVSMNKIIKLKKLNFTVDILKTNLKEFKYLYDFNNDNKILDVCKNIKSFHDIIITNGENEVFYYKNEEIKNIKTIKADVVNTNGAGDSFTGGFIYGICNGYDYIKSIRYGNVCSSFSLKTNYIFPDNISLNEINKLYRRYYFED